MREFSKYEKEIIKRIVSDCDKDGFSISMNIIVQEMEKVHIVAIEWDNEFTYAKFYGISDHKTYTKVFDIVFLLKYLDENRFIYVHSNEDNELYSLFSNERYKKFDEFYWRIKGDGIIGISDKQFSKMHTNIGKEIQYVSKGIIYSSHALNDLVLNDFISPEQRRFKKNQVETWISIVIAALIGFTGIGLNIISLNKSTKFNTSQLKQIEQTLHGVLRDEITKDILKVRVVDVQKNNTIQYKSQK